MLPFRFATMLCVLGLIVPCSGCGHSAAEPSTETASASAAAGAHAAGSPASGAPVADAPTADESGVPPAGRTQTAADAGTEVAAAPAVEPEAPPAAPATPATRAEAAEILDLEAFALPEGAHSVRSSLSTLSAMVPGKTEDVFAALGTALKAQNWTELPGGYASPQLANGTFTRSGYKLSVSATATGGGGRPEEVRVSVINHGNVAAAALPRLSTGVSPLFETPVSASWLATGTVEETAAATHQLFVDNGWEPYGSAGDSRYYRRNAVRANVRIAAAPAQGGKTMIDYSTQLLSAEIPLPAPALQPQFSDAPTQLSFELPGGPDELIAYYRESLAAGGWQATTDRPLQISRRDVLIFRNPQKELIELQMSAAGDGTRALVRFQSAAEVARLDEAARAAAEKAAAAASAPKPRVSVGLPAGAANVRAAKERIEFSVAIGAAKATVEDLQKQLEGEGWKTESAMAEPMFGNVVLSRDGKSLSIAYIESGVLAPDITISTVGIELEQKK